MRISHLALAPFLFLALSSPAIAEAMTDDEIRRILIGESIARYSGNCACPYNTMRNGNVCGGRSAWSRAGGESPLCFPDDVSSSEVAAYRASRGESGVEEVRGRRRSFRGGSQAYSSGPVRSSNDGASSYRKGEKLNRSEQIYDSSPAELDQAEDFGETVPLAPSLEANQSHRGAVPPTPRQPLKSNAVKAKSLPLPPAPAYQRTAEPEVQRIPDCPPGTSLARWNNRNICVGMSESLADVTKRTASEMPTGSAQNQTKSQRQVDFTDVLSSVQAKASDGGQPVQPSTATLRGQTLPAPATGLLNCTGGTRVTYTDGRIECR
jgi:hypothetical protein